MSKFNRIFGLFAVGFGISVIIGYWLQQQEQQQPALPQPTPPAPEPPEETHIVLSSQVLDAAAAKDDLTAINGIGPKIAEALQALGITSFAELAQASAEDLAHKLQSIRGINPEKVTNWIEQARAR